MEGKLPKISKKEAEVMRVLWRERKALTASQIGEEGDELKLNTIQAVLRTLLKKQYIKIADIVYSGTVLTRCYAYVISAEQYAADQLQALQEDILHFSVLNFVDCLREDKATEILNELERAIQGQQNDQEQNEQEGD